MVYLVTGPSGSGKSTVARRLQADGHQAISTDAVEGLCRWTDAHGRLAVRPSHPDAAWLGAHGWNWDGRRLDELIAAADPARPLWLCGMADNQHEFTDRFDSLFGLEFDEETMLRRLDDPARGNDFGRVGESRAALVARLPRMQEQWRRLGAVSIDATAPLDTVVAELLRAGLGLSR
jgi:hypothetical protein